MSIGYADTIVLDIFLSFFATLGIVIQRKSRVDDASAETRRRSFKRPLWHLGFWIYLMFATANSILNLANLPFFVMIPLSAQRLVYNVPLSRWLLKDKITREAIIGTFYIIIAAIIIGMCGSMEEPRKSLDDLIILFSNITFIIYETVSLFVILGITLGLRLYRDRLQDITKGLFLGVLSYILSSQASLFAKSGISLVRISVFDGQNQFVNASAYMVVAAVIILSPLGLYIFNVALKLCDTVVLLPITYCTGVIIASLNSIVYYQGLPSIEPWKWGLISIAMVFLVLGVWFLGKSQE